MWTIFGLLAEIVGVSLLIVEVRQSQNDDVALKNQIRSTVVLLSLMTRSLQNFVLLTTPSEKVAEYEPGLLERMRKLADDPKTPPEKAAKADEAAQELERMREKMEQGDADIPDLYRTLADHTEKLHEAERVIESSYFQSLPNRLLVKVGALLILAGFFLQLFGAL